MSSSVGGPLGTARGSVDRFDQGETAAAFAALASELRVFLNGTKKILDDCLVATKIIDYRGRGALILVSRRSEEHTSELQSLTKLVCRLLLEKKNIIQYLVTEPNLG